MMKVLIVDASKAERARLVSELCEMTNVVVLGAVARLHTALHALGDSAPDVLITDTRLGEDDGSALIVAARRSPTPPAIVVYSSDDSLEDRLRCLDAGADGYVAKQHGVTALKQVLVQVERRRRAVRSASERGRSAARPARAVDAEVTTVDLAAVVRDVVGLVQGSVPAAVRATLALEPAPPVRAVERELERLVVDLVLDACDAIREGGELHVGVRGIGDTHVRLEVAHTGEARVGTQRHLAARATARRHGAKLRSFFGDRGGRVEVDLVAGAPR